jgi:hypothetical protein
MKALHDRKPNLQSQSIAAGAAARVAVIFEQYPTLCGFSVQELSTLTKDRAMVQLHAGLCLADVTVSNSFDPCVTQELWDPIAYLLLELMEEQPEAIGLLRSRTLARTLH